LSMSKRNLFIFLGAFAILFLIEGVAVHSFFGSKVLAAADFHSRWYGGRALLLEGRDPYSPDVTAEIEAIRDPQQLRTNSFSFAFPLHVLYTFWPLTYFSYDWAQSFWIVTLQWVIIGIAILMMYMVGWKPSPLGIAGALLGSILFYPAARTIILGQFTLHVTLFLALSLFFLRRGQDGWAGVWLAATSIKPQMVLIVGLWMVIWALVKKRYQFLKGLLIGGVALLASSLIWLPRWPISFLEDIQRYAEVASGRNPMEVLGESILPGNPNLIVYLVTGILLLLMLAAWYWGLDFTRKGDRQETASQDRGLERFEWVLFWTMAVSMLVLFQTGSTNQALLYIPLFLWFWDGLNSWGRVPAILIAVVLIVGPWILFLATITGDYENPILLLPLPFFCLIVLGLKGWRLRQQGSGTRNQPLETAV
ncbi:MAG: glycosyltransferase family 87 protein, partial [Candidatus Promineifilaceae bacterium]